MKSVDGNQVDWSEPVNNTRMSMSTIWRSKNSPHMSVSIQYWKDRAFGIKICISWVVSSISGHIQLGDGRSVLVGR